MEALAKIAERSELAQQPSDRLSLTTGLGISLPEGTGLTLLVLMRQTCSRYPNQLLPEETKEMYLVEWEEMTQKFGLDLFRDALLKAIRSSTFIPAPEVIRENCASIARQKREREDALKVIRDHDAAKAIWEREREEDRLNGKPALSETEMRLNGILEAARKQDKPLPHIPSLAETAAIIARHTGRDPIHVPTPQKIMQSRYGKCE
jgi:hypothetical protein